MIPKEDCDRIKQYTIDLVNRTNIQEQKMYFVANNKTTKFKGMNFLETGSKIGYLLEMTAIDENENLIVPKIDALNKIGHAQHDCDPEFKKFSYRKEIKSILKDLDY